MTKKTTTLYLLCLFEGNEVVDLTGDNSGDEESEKLVEKLAQEENDYVIRRRKVSTGWSSSLSLF